MSASSASAASSASSAFKAAQLKISEDFEGVDFSRFAVSYCRVPKIRIGVPLKDKTPVKKEFFVTVEKMGYVVEYNGDGDVISVAGWRVDEFHLNPYNCTLHGLNGEEVFYTSLIRDFLYEIEVFHKGKSPA